MRLLAWDTSSKSGVIAALEWAAEAPVSSRRLASEASFSAEAAHSERLLWAIDQVLAFAGWKVSDIDVFAVGVGPGSFTGLRIGVTTARTLAHMLGRPLVAISSLAALARPAAQALASAGRPALVIAATDACKGELFGLWGAAKSVRDCVALAQGEWPGLWKRGVEEKVLTPGELARAIRRKLAILGRASWLVVGQDCLRYRELRKELPGGREIPWPDPFADRIQGGVLAQLAWEGYQAGLARDALGVHPRYLRSSDAELKLRAGLLPPGPTRGEGSPS